jgi:hypothetical protein
MRMLVENICHCIEPALPVVNEGGGCCGGWFVLGGGCSINWHSVQNCALLTFDFSSPTLSHPLPPHPLPTAAAQKAEEERLLLEQTSGAVAKAQARQAALVAQQQLLDDMEDADDEDNALSDQERQERIRRNQERLRQIKDYKDKEKAALDGKERLLFEAEERKREFKATLCKTTVQGMEKGGMQWVEEQLEDRGLDAVTGTTSDIGKEKGGGGGGWVVVVGLLQDNRLIALGLCSVPCSLVCSPVCSLHLCSPFLPTFQ